ncbi:MAG: hypothetical protein RQ966_04620 [Acetobacteraceae bacterium]|nr:hypothetical protein [Acetobacteraceae bacterium]
MGKLTRVLWNAASLVLFRIGADAALLLFYLLLSRRFGAHGLGLYAYGMALSGLAFALPGYGFATFLIRAGSASDQAYRELWPPLRRLAIYGLLAAALLIVLSASWLPAEERLALLIIAAGQFFYFAAEIYRAPFSVAERIGGIAHAELIYKGLIAAVGGSLLLLGAGLPVALGIFPLAGLSYLLFVVRASRPLQPARVERPVTLGAAFRASLPFFATVIVETPMYRQYPVLLVWFSGAATSGVFGAAFKPVEAGLLCLGYLNVALLPTLTRAGAADRRGHGRLFFQSLLIVAVTSMTGAALGVWLAPQFVDMLFGPRFAGAIPVLRILCLALVLASLKEVMITGLGAFNRINSWTAVQAVTLGTGFAGALSLVPCFGAIGAALALCGGEFAGCATAAVCLRVAFAAEAGVLVERES